MHTTTLVWLLTERCFGDSLSQSWTTLASILRSARLARWYLCVTISSWKSFRLSHRMLLDDNDVLWSRRLCGRNTKDHSCYATNCRWVILDKLTPYQSKLDLFCSFRWSQIEGLHLLHNPDVSIVAIGSKEFNIYYLLDGLHARGWHLNGLQNPPG